MTAMREMVRELLLRAERSALGKQGWPATAAEAVQIWKRLEKSLWLENPDHSLGARGTELSEFLQVLMACAGAIHVWDVPFILSEFDCATEEECDEVWEADQDEDAKHMLKLLVFRAYRLYFCKSERLN